MDLKSKGSQIEKHFGAPCLAYNIRVIPPKSIRKALTEVLKEIHQQQPEFLISLPSSSFHISIARILSAWSPYPEGKEEIWSRIGNECQEELSSALEQAIQFDITYDAVIATSDAVIAIARDDGQMSELRKAIHSRLPIPNETTQNHDGIIHTTLARYSGEIRYPSTLLAAVKKMNISLQCRIRELIICRETVYPSLNQEILSRHKLAMSKLSATACSTTIKVF